MRPPTRGPRRRSRGSITSAPENWLTETNWTSGSERTRPTRSFRRSGWVCPAREHPPRDSPDECKAHERKQDDRHDDQLRQTDLRQTDVRQHDSPPCDHGRGLATVTRKYYNGSRESVDRGDEVARRSKRTPSAGPKGPALRGHFEGAVGIPFAAMRDWSSTTVSGNDSACPRPAGPVPRASSSAVRPFASFACRSAPFSARNFTSAV